MKKSNQVSTAFDNYNKRRNIADEELRKINEEITNVTGKITLYKYRLQKQLIDYQHTLHKKTEVDKLLSFHLSSTMNRPKMGIDGYTDELNRINRLYEKFRDKHIDKISGGPLTSVNIYFPDVNRWKVDHLSEIRKEAKQTIGKTHYQLQKQETELFEEFQYKKHKLEWSLKQIESDMRLSRSDRKKKIKNIKDAISQLENDMIEHFSSLSKSFPDILMETQMMDDLSNDQLRKFPIKLEEEPDDKPETRLIKRRLILLKMKQERCKNKIEKIVKEVDDNMEKLNTQKLYESAEEVGHYTKSVSTKKGEIKHIKEQIKELDTYMTGLLESRDILIEEITLLENMESLTHNDIIYDLIKNTKPMIENMDEDEDYLHQIPIECVVDDNMTHIDVDNIDLDMFGDMPEDEITFVLPEHDFDNVNFDTIGQHDKAVLEKNMNQKIHEKTRQELDKLRKDEGNLPIEYPNVFMEIEKNMTMNDLPSSIQSQLTHLNSKLSQLEKIKFDGVMPTEKINETLSKSQNPLTSPPTLDTNTIPMDISMDTSVEDMMQLNDGDLLREFEDFQMNIENLNELNDGNNSSQNGVVNNNLMGLLQINEN